MSALEASANEDFTSLAKKFDKTIHILIKQQVNSFNSSDVCYEYEDVYQDCLTHLWHATKIYDPNRGTKFSTFAIRHMQSRLGNFRNKVLRKNSQGTVLMSGLNSGWGITGREESEEIQSSTVSSQYQEYVESLKGGDDALIEIMDARRVLEKLSGNRKLLFNEYYIKGKKINEICEDNPSFKYPELTRHKKYLEQIYKTLIKGDNSCLSN